MQLSANRSVVIIAGLLTFIVLGQWDLSRCVPQRVVGIRFGYVTA